MSPTLHVVIPLSAVPAAGAHALPTLDRLLSWGERQAIPNPLNRFWQLAGGAPAQAATAALAALGDGLESRSGQWLRVDPVHLAADLRDAVLIPPAELALDAADAASLSKGLGAWLAEDGFDLYVPHPRRWYLHSATHALPEGLGNPQAAAGQPVGGRYPDGVGDQAWRRRLTEIQMVLHAHPANHAREAAGLRTVNAVWPWGGGELVEQPGREPCEMEVYSADPLWRGAALTVGALAAGFPQSLEDVALDRRDRWLIVEEGIPMDNRWFDELAAHLSRRQRPPLMIYLPTIGAWRITRRAWWRRGGVLERLLPESQP